MKNNITRAAVMLLLTFMASATAWADPDLVITNNVGKKVRTQKIVID